MKHYSFFLLAALACGSAGAQNQYDAANFATGDLNGTARYVGMGGALGALGGDVSTMSSNPAGTALFRRGEAAVTGSLLFTDEKGQLGHDATRGSLDQAGAVFALRQDASSRSLRFVNFGVNYQKRRNHFSNLATGIDGLNGIFSQTNQIANLANEAYDTDAWGYLADMAAPAYNTSGDLVKDGILFDNYNDAGNFLGYEGAGAQSALYSRSTYGGTAQTDFNVSFNFKDQYFLGIGIGIYDLSYDRESFYGETGVDGKSYDFSNWYHTDGDGIDVKLGFIWRPVATSPFRLGFTVHTPTWFNMTDESGSTLYYQDNFVQSNATDPFDYKYRTPWKFGFSLGHTVGNYFAVGAEYEYSDFSSTHYSTREWDYGNDQYFRYINNRIEESLKGQHTVKVGMEVKPADNFSIRAGYNFVSSPIKDGSFNILASDSPFTETDFTNWKGVNRFTFGLGYRFKGGFVDLAYQYQTQKGDFYAFDEVDLKPTEIKNDRSQLMATIGFSF